MGGSKEISFDEFLKEGALQPEPKVEVSLEIEKEETIKYVLPAASEASETEVKLFWRLLRNYFRTGEKPEGEPEKERFPVLLAPYLTHQELPGDYPLVLFEGDGTEYYTFAEFLDLFFKETFQAGEAPLLASYLPLIEKSAGDYVAGNGNLCLLRPALEEAIGKLRQIKVSGAEGISFQDTLERLEAAIPPTGQLLGFSQHSPVHLLLHLVKTQHLDNRKAFISEVHRLTSGLTDLLAVEKEKTASGDSVNEIFDFATSLVSFDKLGDLMPENASEAMPETRLNRIRECIQTLKQAEALVLDQSVRIIVGKRLSVDPDFNWDELLQDEAYRIAPDNESCLAASESFSLEMEALSKLMAAARIAKLELQSQFDEEIHTPYFEEFSWDHFSEAELGLCPPVLLIEEAEMLLGKELSAFSALLASNKPVKILALNKGESLPFHLENTSGTEAPSPMEEPGVFAISHRNAFTHQCAAHNPLHLIKGFEAGLEAPSAALFHVLAPADEASGNSFLKVAASVEGRQFPLFTYDNTKGKKWGSRFSIKDNPQAGKDWPEYTLEVETAEKEVQALSLAHTAADFFALNTALNARLLSVPPAFWTEDLIPLTEYLELPTDNLYGKVPFVWQVDTEGLLHKMALSYAWVEACKERLDFWNFIQELGGVNNFHVERAVEQTRTDLLAEKEREIAELKAASEKEIEAVRSSAVGEAMNSLAGVLLDLDPLAVKSAPSKSEKTPESKKKEAAADPIKKEAPAKVEEEDILISEEAWVESYKCTSCNECVNKYPEAFRYDGEKLAYLNDAGAISFRKLVDAAENCPAKCIHPGQPLDPKEAGLEELLERAKPFN